MDAGGFIRIASGSQGPVQAITLRRAGSPDVHSPAAVLIGGFTNVIGEVQQQGDRVLVTDRELVAAGWVGDPRHGDAVIYENGRVTIVQGAPEIYRMESDRVFVLRCLGG